MSRPESELRDYLAEHIELVEQGLHLVEVEFNLPNVAGSRGSVDLLARDAHGMLVVIELKRSDAAARQAIHELYKYTSLISANHGLGPTEVRCVLLSTDWRELAVPFAAFVETSEYHVDGRLLHVDGDGFPAHTELLKPVARSRAVEIFPRYSVLLYRDRASREVGRRELLNSLEDLGINDFFLLSEEKASGGAVMFGWAVTVVLATLSPDLRLRLERSRMADEPFSADSWDHEFAVFAHLFEQVSRHSTEEGSPDRFKADRQQGWRLTDVTRHGRFASTIVWPDDRLEKLAAGVEGSHSVVYNASTSVWHTARFESLRQEAETCLLGAEPWGDLLYALCDELQAVSDVPLDVELYIYSPTDLVWGLELLADGDFRGLPTFRLDVTSNGAPYSNVAGTLAWDGVTVPDGIDETINKVFERGIRGYLLTKTMGEIWLDEQLLCARHGLSYALYERRAATPAELNSISIDSNKGLVRSALDSPLTVFDFAETANHYVSELRSALAELQVAPGLWAW